jgi:hypothetical protein
MLHRAIVALGTLAVLAGCSTPYRPPVFVPGGPSEFSGLVGVVDQSKPKPVDVVLVHGMCTHDASWAETAIALLVNAIDANVRPTTPTSRLMAEAVPSIQTVTKDAQVAGGTIHFTALVWSPLTTPLKEQLGYDSTGTPTDCSRPGECKPTRASLNGKFKDTLMNDCLSDAMIYEGRSHDAIKKQMVSAIKSVIDNAETHSRATGVSPGPLVLVTESLGSKLTFDALADMLEQSESNRLLTTEQRDRLAGRLALVFMGANQLPILGLADQTIPGGPSPSAFGENRQRPDSLQNLLNMKKPTPDKREETPLLNITVIAFTDPNDLLSYRLMPSRYDRGNVKIADIIVSNASTYFGLFENPLDAHMGYRDNTDVAAIIACGHPRNKLCSSER